MKLCLQVVDGTFTEEPGSGAVAIIGNRKVCVGTMDWLCRFVLLKVFILSVLVSDFSYTLNYVISSSDA